MKMISAVVYKDNKAVSYLKKENELDEFSLQVKVDIFNISAKRIKGFICISVYNEDEDKQYIMYLTKIDKQKTKKISDNNYYLSLTFTSKTLNFKKGLYRIDCSVKNNGQEVLANTKTYAIID